MRCWLIALLLAGESVVMAQAPEWQRELTHVPPAGHLHVPPCEMTFELGWNDWVTAGKAALSVRESGTYWRADASASSTGFARTLWRYDCEMTSVIERAGISPHYLEHAETDREETCRYRVSFQPTRVTTETTVAPKKGVAHTTTAVCKCGPMDDLLSVILYVRSQALTPDQKITRVVQPWDKPYLTTFEVLGRETLEFGGKKRPCIKVAVKIRRIDRSTLALSSYKKMKTSTIWISDDALRLPIEMHADIFVGYMSARMTGMRLLTGKEATASLPRNMTVREASQ
ncbi:MAG: DUF3108 domain-containing protein [Verrucomicrobiaceae bacterium]